MDTWSVRSWRTGSACCRRTKRSACCRPTCSRRARAGLVPARWYTVGSSCHQSTSRLGRTSTTGMPEVERVEAGGGGVPAQAEGPGGPVAVLGDGDVGLGGGGVVPPQQPDLVGVLL